MSVLILPSARGGAVVLPNPSGGIGTPGASGAPGANVMAVGLFTALSLLSVPVGTTLIQTAGHTAQGKGHAIYVEDTTLNDAAVAAYPDARAKTANGRYFRLSDEQLLHPHQFGNIDSNDGTLRDTGAKLQAMLDYLHATAINPSSSGFYKGAAPIAWGRNHFHSTATTLEPLATIEIYGCGSGRWGPDGDGGASSLLSFGPNCTGVRLPFPNTTGDTGTTGTTHDGSSSFIARSMRWRGGYNGLGFSGEGEYHGFVARAPYQLEDITIDNFAGTGFLARAGTVTGLGNILGNVSVSYARGVKVVNCRDGFILGGADGNIMRFDNCEAYQNRRYGLFSENGAGSGLVVGLHCASNGMISNVGVYTQTSSAGNVYALKEGGNLLNAPSGTTADTADWDYVEAGGVIANLRPAYAATPGLFRAGGDMVAVGSDGTRFLECYSEYGGFNRGAALTIFDGGTIGDQYFRGGIRLNPRSDGYTITQSPNVTLRLKHRSTQAAIVAVDELGVEHAKIELIKTAGNYQYARDATGHNFYTAPYGGSWTFRGRLGTSGLELPSGHAVYVNGLQVLGARQTGCPAAATDLASAITLVNFLRTAGLALGGIGT